jgi:hypothetical protein
MSTNVQVYAHSNLFVDKIINKQPMPKPPKANLPIIDKCSLRVAENNNSSIATSINSTSNTSKLATVI